MRSRSLFASILMTCVMVVALLGGTPTADADVTDQSFKKSGKIAKIKAVKRRDRVRIHLPIGPSYVFYDYPYYYSRGYYPTHIGGYVYYPYFYHRSYYPRHVGARPPRREKPHSDLWW